MPLFSHEITTLGLSDTRSNPLENPAVSLSSPAVFQWLSNGEPTAAGELINEANALQITTVYACIRVLAESVASLPLELWERTDSGHQKAVDQNLYYLLAVEANPEMSAFTWKESTIGSLSLTGNSYSQIERNTAGQPVAIWPLHPFKTEPFRQPNNIVAYRTSDGMLNGQTRIVDAEDVLHLSLFSFDGLKGISPIEMARQSLGLAKASEKFGARFFGNGTNPGGVLMNKGPKPDPKAQKEISESWYSQQGGSNQGKTAFLFGAEWSYQQLGLSPEESQFLATRQFQRSEICALFRVPPHFVGDTTRLSGTNSEQMSLSFATQTLQPILNRFTGEITRKLIPTQGRKANKFFIQWDLTDLLKMDFKTQMEGYAAGRQWGWYTGNDVRRKLGENPAEPEAGLDVYLVPVNLQNAARLLDTESMQDQPIGATAPTQAERNLLGVYTRSYITLYKDAFGRLLHRNKRDLDTISALFRPVLRSIADTAVAENGLDAVTQGSPADNIVNDALRAMECRAAKWPATLSTSETDELCRTEFNRAVRAIHIATSREIAAAKASTDLTPTTTWNGTEDAQAA
jgi:HK97 family phage portal protein